MKLDADGFPILDGVIDDEKQSNPISSDFPLKEESSTKIDADGFPILNPADLPNPETMNQDDLFSTIEEKKKKEEESSWLRRSLGDLLVATAKGIVGVPEAGLGLIDLAIAYGLPVSRVLRMAGWKQGNVAKLLSEIPKISLDFEETQKVLGDLYSPEAQASLAKVQEAKGIGGTVKAAIQNPASLVLTGIESIPTMAAGGAIGKVAGTAGKLLPSVAGAIGEGTITAGSALEQGRQQSESGTLTDTQAALLGGSGLLTGLLSLGGGKAADYLHLTDIDTLLATGTTEAAKKVLAENKAKVLLKVIGGAVQEGWIEEFPQGLQEQIAMNLSSGKKWDDGLANSATMGALVGMFMGGGANTFSALGNKEQARNILKAADQTQTVADDFLWLPTPVTVEGQVDTAAGPVPLVPDTPVERPSALEVGTTSENLLVPEVQLKSGVDLTKDHAAFLFEHNYKLDPLKARLSADILERLARGQGVTLTEFVKMENVALGITQEKAPGFAYEFMAPPTESGSVKITKLEDGTWRLDTDVLRANKVLDKSSKILKSDDDVLRVARKLSTQGYANQTFFQDEMKAKRKVLNPATFSVSRNRVEGWDIVDAKGKPVATAFDSSSEATQSLEEMKKAFATGEMFEQSVYHGTPHTYEAEPGFPHGRPRLDKIGTGEGAQAYGWGWYSAENPSVAKSYEKVCWLMAFDGAPLNDSRNPDATLRDIENLANDAVEVAARYNKSNPVEAAIKELSKRGPGVLEADAVRYDKAVQYLKENGSRYSKLEPKGGTYTLDLPDDIQGRLLEWDKPLKDMHPEVQAILKKAHPSLKSNETGEEIYKLMGPKEKASAYLASLGIVGNKYLDQGSRQNLPEVYIKQTPRGWGVFEKGGPLVSSGQETKEVAQSRADNINKRRVAQKTYNYVIWDQSTLDRTALLERNGEKLDAIRQQVEESFQQGKKGASARGALFISATGEKIIAMMKTGNFSTVVHEFGHLMLPLLNEKQRSVLAKWAAAQGVTESQILDIMQKKQDGSILTKAEREIYTAVHEKFARTFEEYLRTGKAPTSTLRELFRYCKDILSRIYFHAAKVPGSELTPEITEVFDQLLLGPEELYGRTVGGKKIPGRIRIIGGKVKTFFREVVTPDVEYEIVERNNQPVIILDDKDKTEIPVMNLIRGETPTQQQLQELGSRLEWVSPFEVEDSYTYDKLVGDRTVYSELQLQNLPIQKLESLARRLGIKLGSKKLPANYPRPVLEKLVQEAQIAKVVIDNPNATMEDLEDSREVTQLPAAPKNNLFDVVYNVWSAWLLDVVRDFNGGGVIQDFHYGLARKATDASHALIGEQNEAVLKVQRLTRSILNGRTRRALSELMDGTTLYDASGKKVGFISNLAALLDKKYERYRPANVSAEAHEVLFAVRQFLDQQARIAAREKMSVLLTDENGKESRVPFTLDAGDRAREVMPRSFTEDFWRILQHEDPVMRGQLAKALSVANNTEMKEAIKMVESLRQKSKKEAILYLESKRLIDVMPTHISMPNGRLVEILYTDPFTYVQRLQLKLALRVGFFRAYAAKPLEYVDKKTHLLVKSPDYKVIDPKNLDRMVQDFNKRTNGGGVHLERLFRTLNGLPVTDSFYLNVDHPGYMIYRALHELLTVKKALWLTKAAIVNVTEPVGAFGITGPRRWMQTAGTFSKALAPHLMMKGVNKLGKVITFKQLKLFEEALSNDHWTMMKDAAIRNGTMAPHMVRFAIDPRFAVSSAVKQVSDGIVAASGTTGAISFGEHFVAWAGHLMAKDMAAGKTSNSDRVRLKMMGFTDAEVNQMMTKPADSAELYAAIPIRMVTTLLGTNTLPAERSLWKNWRYARDVIAFDTYGATMSRFYNAHLRELYLRRTGKPQSKYKGWKKFAEDTARLGSLAFTKEGALTLGSKTAAGILATGLRQLLTFGPAALLFVDWDDEEEKWYSEYTKFGIDAFLQSTMSGPLANFYYDYKRGQMNPIKTLENAILPLIVLHEMFNLTNKLLKAPVTEKPIVLKNYMLESTAASGAIGTWFAILHHGFNAQSPRLKIAKRKFWAYYNTVKPLRGDIPEKKYDDDYDFYMQHAFDRIMDTENSFNANGDLRRTDANKDVEYHVKRLLKKALQVKEAGGNEKANKEVAERIKGKRLLPRLNEQQREVLRKKIGNELYEELQESDWVLDWWSKKVKGDSL